MLGLISAVIPVELQHTQAPNTMSLYSNATKFIGNVGNVGVTRCPKFMNPVTACNNQLWADSYIHKPINPH